MTKKRLTKAQLLKWARERGACADGLARFQRMNASPARWWARSKTGDDMGWVVLKAEPYAAWDRSQDYLAWYHSTERVEWRKMSHGERAAHLRKHYRWETAEALILAGIERSRTGG